MSDIPRGEWAFDGMVITDWGAMNDRVAAIRAGLDLEMPGSAPENCQKIVDAVQDGTLGEDTLTLCAERVTAFAVQAAKNQTTPYDRTAHHELARRVARESAVLLKRGSALPAAKSAKIAVVGSFAKSPRYQGAGSGKIHPTALISLCDALDAQKINYTYAQGYEPEAEGVDDALIAEAVAAVVSTGGVVLLPWRERVDSILLLSLAGQNGGSAAADLLFGDACPSGKLAETWPLSLEDVPCRRYFGMGGNVEYRESIYVG